eukprot:Gb_05314 [translate_table: standard]
MVRARRWWPTRNPTTLICVSATILFFVVLFITSRNLSKSGGSALLMDPASFAESRIPYSKQRTELYEKMSRDLDEHGAIFLAGGETSQSLSLSDLFTLKNGLVTPVLKSADPPVRANVLYLAHNFSQPIS